MDMAQAIRNSIREKQDEKSAGESVTLSLRTSQIKVNLIDEAAGFYALNRADLLDAWIDAALTVYHEDCAKVQELEKIEYEQSYAEEEISSVDNDVRYFFVNTNANNSKEDHDRMLKEGKASAFYTPWKYKIRDLRKGDHVFLYYSGNGIVAHGIASGVLLEEEHKGKEGDRYSQVLLEFKTDFPPITAKKCKDITRNNGLPFRHTLAKLPNRKQGEALLSEINDRLKLR